MPHGHIHKVGTPAQEVKAIVQGIFDEYYLAPGNDLLKIGFQEVWLWESLPTQNNGFWHTRVTLTGNTRFSSGQARYEGPYGVWLIDLASQDGFPHTEQDVYRPCTRTWGKARCQQASEVWHETEEQRRERVRLLLESDPDAMECVRPVLWTRVK